MVVEVPRWTNAKMEVSFFYCLDVEFLQWPEEFLLLPLSQALDQDLISLNVCLVGYVVANFSTLFI